MDTQQPNQPSIQGESELHLPHITGQHAAQLEPVIDLPVQNPVDSKSNVFYLQDGFSREEDDADVLSSPLATPFQMSEPMTPLQVGTNGTPASPAAHTTRKFPLRRVLILAAVIIIVILTGAMAFAQPAAPALPVHTTATPAGPATVQHPAPVKPQPTQAKNNPTTPPTPGGSSTTAGQNTSGAGTWLPQQLPTGWTNAGLAAGDALFSERTAVAFTDREMSLDYRSVGTRTHHSGTFTAATFILTANAKTRFAQNDVRVINNTLFDNVQQEKLIQSVVNAQPRLVQFASIGQQQFAWVDVSFQLWQSKINAGGTRTESFDRDATPHHMMVLLLRVPQNVQGNNPAMGGTGWLVSTYAFDPPSTTLPVVQPA